MTPEEVVRSFFDAHKRLDVEGIIGFFTEDAVWHNMPAQYEPAVGREAVAELVTDFFSRTTAAELEIINIAVNGNLVFTERVDHCVYGGTKLDAPVVGVLEIEGDKIKAWREYFDGHDQVVATN